MPVNLDTVKRQFMGEGNTSETIKHHLKFFRDVLILGIRDGRLGKNPFALLTMTKTGHGRTQFLTMDEDKLLLKTLGPPYTP